MPGLGFTLPPSFFQIDFEHRWVHLPKDEDSSIFRRIWGWKKVLASAKESFQAYEFGIPRPAHDEQGVAGARFALQKKWTLVQNHVHRRHPALAKYVRLASMTFGLPGGLNSYTTPAFSTGFGYHFDPSDAIILQVQGNKSWELCARRLTNSFSFANLTYNQVPEGDEDLRNCSTVVMQEGDALYLPIGQAGSADQLALALTTCEFH
ncbi:Ribosomal oxygenase 1 (Bifunctional lysine-specific demethylase and histidyl-hydroxylase NO66) (Histone lysine demethylase NO66) [Durusdinium trenchii]|uniref:Bifunctional lysine-specific demethylase and histidyl-hydroxylase n=1 Tax=Durusdinium trenchii TaxID=1381693 RepID=A0ABP0K5R9_9DINO